MLQVNEQTKKLKRVSMSSMTGFLTLLLLFFALSLQSAVAGEKNKGDSPKVLSVTSTDSAIAPQPFAKVYLALQGCTSCAACRSVIRQMTKGAAKDGKVSLPSDAVEINYDEPTEIPLKKVVGNLAKNRLHNLKLVDVLFDVSGKINSESDGSLMFTIETTGQQFALSTPDGVDSPPENKALRLSAVVEGWRGSDDLTLKLKSFTVNN